MRHTLIKPSPNSRPCLPDLARLYATIGTTWPAVETRRIGPVTVRRGLGGGSRVSAATADRVLTTQELQSAETAMRDWDQTPRFMLRHKEDTFDAQLADAGYLKHDVTVIYMCNLDVLTAHRPPPVSTFVSWPELQVQRDIWETGGIGSSRLAVMHRAPMPKTTILGRVDDAPSGTTFVACNGTIAMVHAVEVLPLHRRKGLAKHMMTAAAFWARDHGATHMSLLTTQANKAANPLYASLQMDVVGSYHYRKLPE